MKTKNYKYGLIICSLLIIIIVSSSIGLYAWAKYTQKISGNAIAQIAKWSFKVNGSETGEFASFDLSTTMNPVNGVVAGKIAPGTSGAFDIEIDASESEVAIDYYITMNAINLPTNLKLYNNSTYTDEIPAVGNVLSIQGFIPLEELNTPVIKTIYWNWPYQTGNTNEAIKNNDKIDTNENGMDCLIQINVKGVQAHSQNVSLKQGAFEIDNPKENYQTGETITIKANYNEPVYDKNGTPLTKENAPQLQLAFVDDETQLAQTEEITKVASTSKNINLKVADVNNVVTKVATCTNVNGGVLTYTYKVQSDDIGELQIGKFSGVVYDKYRREVNAEIKQISNVEQVNANKLVYLFNEGNLYTDVTGGWRGFYADGTNSSLGSYSIGTKLICSTTNKWCRYNIETINEVDVTRYKKLVVEYEYTSLRRNTGYADNVAAIGTNYISDGYGAVWKTNWTREIDISEYTGLNKIVISTCNGAECSVSKIYLK